MKGLMAKKQTKVKKDGIELADRGMRLSRTFRKQRRYWLGNKNHEGTRQEVKTDRSRTVGPGNGSTAKSKAWQPSFNSISEAGSS